ncbi:MAG: hypothetical protein PVG20_05025 [Thioalkalispiraceae bacterium]|jgi:hypothetical protein
MISFLYQLANKFEVEHGFRPNILYLNPKHYSQLRADLAQIKNLDELVTFLGMEVVLAGEMSHPHVAYSVVEWENSQVV